MERGGTGEEWETDIDDDGLVLEHFASVDPHALHQDLPPSFGPLHFAPLPPGAPVGAWPILHSRLGLRLPFHERFDVRPYRPRGDGRPLQRADLVQLLPHLRFDVVHGFRARPTHAQDAFLAVDQHDGEDATLDDLFL